MIFSCFPPCSPQRLQSWFSVNLASVETKWNESTFVQAIIETDFKSKLTKATLLDFAPFSSIQYGPSDWDHIDFIEKSNVNRGIRLKISQITFPATHPQMLTAIESLDASVAVYVCRSHSNSSVHHKSQSNCLELRIYLQAITFSTFRRTYWTQLTFADTTTAEMDNATRNCFSFVSVHVWT